MLIAANGAYGLRMTDILPSCGHCLHAARPAEYTSAGRGAHCRTGLPQIRHHAVSMVHSETTSGILNDIEAVGKVVKAAGKTFIVDAMSSFGGVDIPVVDYGIDFLISSANKCIQGVPASPSSSHAARSSSRAAERHGLAVARPVRAVEEHERGRQVALYFSDARDHGVC